VGAEVIIGANVLKDFLAGLPEVFGGHAGFLQEGHATKSPSQELKACTFEKGGDAVVGVNININHHVLGQSNSA
jgi:uncharacterized protein YbjQ (UPF0145 family)